MMESKLPDRPSDLIEVALRDLEKIEAMQDKYRVNMWNWHEMVWDYDDNGIGNKRKCSVCLAGSVMAGTLGANSEEDHGPEDFPEEAGKLNALSDFMFGQIDIGLLNMGHRVNDGEWPIRTHTAYSLNPSGFKDDMRRLARDLRAAGL